MAMPWASIREACREPNDGSEGGSRERDGVLISGERVPVRGEFGRALGSRDPRTARVGLHPPSSDSTTYLKPRSCSEDGDAGMHARVRTDVVRVGTARGVLRVRDRDLAGRRLGNSPALMRSVQSASPAQCSGIKTRRGQGRDNASYGGRLGPIPATVFAHRRPRTPRPPPTS